MLKVIGGAKEGEFKATASGTLPNGKPVVVNSDGTVSVVSGEEEGLSSQVSFSGRPSNFTQSAFDSTNNKVVIVYANTLNSSYGTAVVGTVSGSTITFGTPVVYESGECVDFDVAFVGSGKVLICYRNQSSTNDGTGRVGTISGTSISFGSGTVFFTSASAISVGYDPVQGKGVVHYRKDTVPQYRVANVATISGTSVSFGSQTNIYTSTNAESQKGYGTTAFDSNANKLFFAWVDSAFSIRTAVGTISGTSISFGSSVTAATGTHQYPSATFDSSNNKIVMAWEDNTNGDGKVIVGTISGTSVSFGAAVTFSTTTPASDALAVSYNTEVGQTLIAYSDYANTSVKLATVSGTSITLSDALTSTFDGVGLSATYDSNSGKNVLSAKSGNGASIVYSPASTNLTAENYIGISSGGAVADTQNATVDIIGTVNSDQTGLTTGEQYYVQSDGTLSTTADDPSVLAGTAISATKLVVKT